MLSVGRELHINNKSVVCRMCDWEGPGVELSTGLVQVNGADLYFYAYRCPACRSFDVSLKGKLLRFRPRLIDENEAAPNELSPIERRSG
jgi:hypothetical protein